MTTLARLSFRAPPERMADVESVYQNKLAPILKQHGLEETHQANRPIADAIFSRLFAVDSLTSVEKHEQALKQDPAWQQILQSLLAAGDVRYAWGMYQTPAGVRKKVEAGPGTTVPAGEGTTRTLGPGFSQGEWQSFSLLDGIPGCVESLLQDRHGALWWATGWGTGGGGEGEGLCLYDSLQVRRFTPADGLPHADVYCLLEDGEGILWIGTEGGLSRYDGHTFTNFTTRDGLADPRVLSLMRTRAGDLWIGTEGGVSCYDGHTFTNFTTRDGLAHDRVTCMAEDRTGRLWFGAGWGAGVGVSCYDGHTFTNFTTAEGLDSDWTLSLLVDRNGTLWLGTNESVDRYDGQRFTMAFDTDLAQTQGGVLSMRQDRAGHLWFAVWGQGAWRYDGQLLETFTTRDGLASDTAISLLEDQAGQLWVGTRDGGLSRYSGQRVETFTTEDGLLLNHIGSIWEDRQDRLWVGSRRGMNLYDGTRFQAVDALRRLAVSYILEDRQGHLWFAIWGRGVGRWDGQQLEIFTPRKVAPMDIITYPLLEDREGRLWFGTQGEGGGLSLYDGRQWTPFTGDIGMAHHTVGCMHQDRDGRLWFGGAEGLSRWDGRTFERFTTAEGLPHNHVFRLLEDRRNHLWIGTEGGLSRYDDRTFTNFTTAEGLPHNRVFRLLEDSRGHLWISTRAGLCRYDGRIFQPLSRQDGLPHDLVAQVLEDRQGTMWIGTAGGLTRYQSSSRLPQVALQTIIADQEYEPDDDIHLSVSQKRVEFVFQGRSWTTRPEGVAYVYRLEGHDTDWKPVYRRRVAYQDLPVGEYTFQVKAVDRDLNYSEPAEIEVTIEPDLRLEGWKEALGAQDAAREFVGTSPALRQVQTQLAQVAPTDVTVLILGDTGTGKGLAARALHGLSARKNGPFFQVNCGSLPSGLVESELFGHEPGAFTGATRRKLGMVELAEGGTLFLDEIGDLPLEAQVKLLHFLEERTFERVGGTRTLTADVRLVAATNRNLQLMVRQGAFREDLYFRLQVFKVQLPRLRERRGDIPQLAHYFMERMAQHLGKEVDRLLPETLELLQSYDWPGNVRELENAIKGAVIVCPGPAIRAEDIALERRGSETPVATELLPLEEIERRHVRSVLEHTGWVISGAQGAAAVLGLHEATLRYRMKKLGIRRPPT